MAKKQLTPEQYKEQMGKKDKKREAFSQAFLSALAVLLAFVITFGAVSMAYNYAVSNKKNVVVNNPSVQGTEDGNMEGFGDSSIITEDSDFDIITENGDDSVSNDPGTPDGEQKVESTDKGESSAFASTEEMVAYFNKCANKVKTDAKKVVKNFEKRAVGELKVPDVLQSIAEKLLKDNMKDDTNPITYATKQEIRDNFLVPNQDYVSCLKASDVVKADCKDNGDKYVIYFKLKDEKNPRAGSGIGSVCDVIEAYEVQEKAPSFLKEFSTSYYNCEVTATIDKATGRMVHAVYTTPLILNVEVELFGNHSANVGFTFTKDYSITY